MRRVVLAGLVSAIAFAAFAAPAPAFFDPEFSVIAVTTGGHKTNSGSFVFGEKLVDANNHSNGVGRDRGVCAQAHGSNAKCRVVIRLNGEVGGFGVMRVNGNVGRGDNRLNVVGGTHSFNGAAGKVLVHSLSRRVSLLEFHLVK